MGIFDDAGVDVSAIPNDPFGFGKDYWPVQVIEAPEPDVSKSGKQYGTMIKWKCVAPQFVDTMESLGYGNWLQIPAPKYVSDTVPSVKFDINSENGKRCIYQLSALFNALGFSRDEFNSIEMKDLVDKVCLAKIFPKLDEEYGSWKFNIVGFKPLPEEARVEGEKVFAKKDGSSGNTSSGGMSAMEKALQEEMKNNSGS